MQFPLRNMVGSVVVGIESRPDSVAIDELAFLKYGDSTPCENVTRWSIQQIGVVGNGFAQNCHLHWTHKRGQT